ncbi:hypothetical protein BJH93_00945 [Kocuria polaris]|nr:hypothetical protein [Kocuria polaris]
MQALLIEDDGHFIVHESTRKLADSIEQADEVSAIFDEDAHQYEAQQVMPGVIRLVDKQRPFDAEAISRLWNDFLCRQRVRMLRRGTRDLPTLLRDIFEVLCLTSNMKTTGSWTVLLNDSRSIFSAFKDVLKCIRKVPREWFAASLVRDPFGHEYSLKQAGGVLILTERERPDGYRRDVDRNAAGTS